MRLKLWIKGHHKKVKHQKKKDNCSAFSWKWHMNSQHFFTTNQVDFWFWQTTFGLRNLLGLVLSFRDCSWPSLALRNGFSSCGTDGSEAARKKKSHKSKWITCYLYQVGCALYVHFIFLWSQCFVGALSACKMTQISTFLYEFFLS